MAFGTTLSTIFDHVDKVEDGKQALNLVLAHQPSYYNAIVLDISMPIMGGVEACTKIVEYFNRNQTMGTDLQTPFVYALTAESEEQVLR